MPDPKDVDTGTFLETLLLALAICTALGSLFFWRNGVISPVIVVWLVGTLAQALICAFLCKTVASSKRYKAKKWFAAGFFFGIFALITAAGLADRNKS